MTPSTAKQSRRGGAFGCLVVLLIFGGLFATFRYFQKREQQRVQAIEQNVMAPYWAAIKTGDYETAHSLRSQDWQAKHTVEELADAYAKVISEHGEVQRTYIHVANEFHEPGQVGDACRVESIYDFKDGLKAKIIFTLSRSDSESTWQLGDSTTPVSLSLGDGPY